MDGEVIGVNTAIFSPTGGSVGIGFAVPSLVAQNIVEQLRETGVVERGWLGVQIQAVNEELAEALELAEPAGALIADVARGGPADEAGLRAGDVVIDFAGEDIETPRDLTFAVAEFEQGSDAAVRIVRDGEEQLISVEIGALPQPDMPEPSASPAEDGPELGVSLAPMTPELRERFGVTEGVEGAIISGVRNGSPAAEAGLRSGDVVVEANGTPIEAPQDLVEVVEQVAEENGTILMRLFRQGAYDFRVVSLEET
jgi:serine protease Do